MNWWGTRTHPSARMVAEIAAMKSAFDKSKPVRISATRRWDCDINLETTHLELNTEDSMRPFWLISFRMHNLDPDCKVRSKGTWTIKVRYPIGYPDKEPRVTVESHNVNDAPHLLYERDGDTRFVCLDDHAGIKTGWDPARSTAATFAVWTVQWIRTYIYWRRGGSWPETV